VSTLIEYPDVEQRSEQWHDLRRGMVTASTVAQLLTPTLKVANNDTSRAVTTALVAERITGVTEPTFTSDDMWRGVLHEPIARGYYAEKYGPVREYGFMVRQFDGFEIGLSPDGLVGDDGLLEIKCPRAKGHVQTILADQVPAVYMAQCQTALLVSGRDWLDFVSFHGGLPLFVKRVYPDPAWHDAIKAAAEAFERNAELMVTNYRNATRGLPLTERVPTDDLGLVF
jgi:putative phage-type endonuclease